MPAEAREVVARELLVAEIVKVDPSEADRISKVRPSTEAQDEFWQASLRAIEAALALREQSLGGEDAVIERCAEVAKSHVNEKNAHPEYNMAAWDIETAIRALKSGGHSAQGEGT